MPNLAAVAAVEYLRCMAAQGEQRYVTASDLVQLLADSTGLSLEIERNGGSVLAGDLISATLGSTAIDGVDRAVVHLVIRRPTRDGSTPVMVSLVTGVAPDEDFFWPVCPVIVSGPKGVERLALR